jgi:hypothetical protein
MLTPNLVLKGLRLAAIVCGIAMVGLLLGPFQGLEKQFGLSDHAAHAIAAFAVCMGLFAVCPRWRRKDVALIVIGLGAAIEVVQGLTGRSMSLSDLLSDMVGVVIALIPGYIEQFRRLVQTSGYESFDSIRQRDRRRPSGRRVRVPGHRTARSETPEARQHS